MLAIKRIWEWWGRSAKRRPTLKISMCLLKWHPLIWLAYFCLLKRNVCTMYAVGAITSAANGKHHRVPRVISIIEKDPLPVKTQHLIKREWSRSKCIKPFCKCFTYKFPMVHGIDFQNYMSCFWVKKMRKIKSKRPCQWKLLVPFYFLKYGHFPYLFSLESVSRKCVREKMSPENVSMKWVKEKN